MKASSSDSIGAVQAMRVQERAAPASAEREVLLQIDHLVKEFPVTSGVVIQRKLGTVKAVSDVSFSVRRGETFGLVGESGCGKTTIGWLIVALHRATAGSIRFEGEELTKLAQVGAAATASRSAADVPGSVRVARPAHARRSGRARAARRPGHRVARGAARAQVGELLAEVGLSPRAAELYPHEFSGGQRQRIGLARALALSPKLIVADEPVSALDVSIQAQILNLMRELQRAHQLTYVVISHDLAVVKYLADTIGVMYLGKLVEIGPAEEIYARAAHPYTRGLIDAIAIPDPVAARARKVVRVRGELPSAITPPSGCRFRTRCPLAQPICSEQEPPLRPFGSAHHAACHFPLQPPRLAPLQSHLERVAQRVADEVERDDDEDDRNPDRVDLPPVAVERGVDAVGEHRSPVGERRRDAEADEPERGEQQDRVRDLERRVHDDRADRVGDDVPQHDAAVAAAHDADREHVLADAQRQRLAADEPGRHEPGR